MSPNKFQAVQFVYAPMHIDYVIVIIHNIPRKLFLMIVNKSVYYVYICCFFVIVFLHLCQPHKIGHGQHPNLKMDMDGLMLVCKVSVDVAFCTLTTIMTYPFLD